MKMDNWIHPWLGCGPGAWDRRARNKEIERIGKTLSAVVDPGVRLGGKEVQTGGLGRQDCWRGMLASSQWRGLVRVISGEPSWVSGPGCGSGKPRSHS